MTAICSPPLPPPPPDISLFNISLFNQASKLTGMLLELDEPDVLPLLSDLEEFKDVASQALEALMEAESG